VISAVIAGGLGMRVAAACHDSSRKDRLLA